MTDLLADAHALQADLVELRHALHREPELGLELPRTQEKVLAALADLPLEVTTGTSSTSVTAVLRGAHPGPTVLLRGDMDALPIAERTDVPYVSQVEGVMHACGHDLHTTMLVGAARLLAARQQDLHGDVVFMFQPGEEGYYGAHLMIEEGVLEATGQRPVAAYGTHVYSGLLHAGQFATRVGAQTSSSAAMYVTVRGRGGHGSRPHLAKDPVPAACEMVLALQHAVTREIDIFDPVVITVGRIAGGTKRNVIPDEVEFDATIRSYSPAARDRVHEIAVRVCEGVAAANGVEVDIRYDNEYPPMLGTAEAKQRVESAVADLFGADRFIELEHPMYGSEDFAFVLEQVPGTFVVLGAAPPGTDLSKAPSNHSAVVEFHDSVLCDGAALHAKLVLGHLG